MAALLPEHPEALANTLEVAGKVEAYKIDRPHVLPKYEIDPAQLISAPITKSGLPPLFSSKLEFLFPAHATKNARHRPINVNLVIV